MRAASVVLLLGLSASVTALGSSHGTSGTDNVASDCKKNHSSHVNTPVSIPDTKAAPAPSLYQSLRLKQPYLSAKLDPEPVSGGIHPEGSHQRKLETATVDTNDTKVKSERLIIARPPLTSHNQALDLHVRPVVLSGEPENSTLPAVAATNVVTAAEIRVSFASVPTLSPTLDRTGWTVVADSSQAGNPASNLIDSSTATFWHSQWNPQQNLPHNFIIDMKALVSVKGLTYLPRQDGILNGNVGEFSVDLSLDGTTWSQVATGTYADDKTLKQTVFPLASARFVRFTAMTEAGGRGSWASAADINLIDGGSSARLGITVDSEETTVAANQGTNAIDGNLGTIWHTRFSGTAPIPAHPHTAVLDLGATYGVSALSYTPRQDGNLHGNIGLYGIDISLDGIAWTNVAQGAFADDNSIKVVDFSAASARYVRLMAFTEAGGRGPWTSAAEIGVSFASVPSLSPTLDRTSWTVVADSSQAGNPASNLIDSSTATFWHSQWNPQQNLPHNVIIDMKALVPVRGLTYLPRQDGILNGNVGQHSIDLSLDGTAWSQVATGTYADDNTLKQTVFPLASARFVRFTAMTEAGGRGSWASAADIKLVDGASSANIGITVDSQETTAAANQGANAIDGNPGTIWHTRFSGLAPIPAHPHTAVIDLGATYGISALTYTPRQDGNLHGNIGLYGIDTSADGTAWTNVAQGAFIDDHAIKRVDFAASAARYVRLTAYTEAGNRGPWTSVAEIGVSFANLPSLFTTLDRTGWTVLADSSQASNPASNLIDSSTVTFWHSQWNPQQNLPHNFVIDMKAQATVRGLTYLPRQDGKLNGNVGQHSIDLSLDGTTWNQVATGTYADDNTLKQTVFPLASARFVRFTAMTEAGGRGSWASAADINLIDGSSFIDLAITVDSQETTAAKNQGANAIDSNPGTIWHTRFSGSAPIPAHPHTAVIDLGATYGVSALSYTPRQDGNLNGNIGQHNIDVSLDGVTWTNVARGEFEDDNAIKVVRFDMRSARYVRLIALSEAGNRGPWTSAAEIGITFTTVSLPLSAGLGHWGITIDFPIIPVAAVLLPDTGKLLTWSSYTNDAYGGNGGMTVTATYDPTTGLVSERTVTNTGHDMFCPGLSIDMNGRAVVTGGDNSQQTSIYDPVADAWLTGPQLNIPRGYQASATMSDGRTFMIGGSWSGGEGGKNGEVLDAAGTKWTLLPGCPVAPMLTADRQGVFRADNHGWLFGWKAGWVFQAGPSKAMNWYNPSGNSGNGSTVAAGVRGTDGDAMNGNAVMYDAVNGLILTLGGAPSYQDDLATANANIIQLGAPGVAPIVTGINPMWNPRAFANAVVLPDGKVFVTGGQTYAEPFSDDTAIFQPELWDPATRTFTRLPLEAIPRTYHSVALLMPDATVFSGGGGLCGACATNHFDGQVYSPPYLFKTDGSAAIRPVILSLSTTVVQGGDAITIVADQPITTYALIRFGSATHTVDTDQRRIALTPVAGVITIPADPGVAIPGYWMVFALNAVGTPSSAKTILIMRA